MQKTNVKSKNLLVLLPLLTLLSACGTLTGTRPDSRKAA